jgi:hypothetical protein
VRMVKTLVVLGEAAREDTKRDRNGRQHAIRKATLSYIKEKK